MNTRLTCIAQQGRDQGLTGPAGHMALLALRCPCRHCLICTLCLLAQAPWENNAVFPNLCSPARASPPLCGAWFGQRHAVLLTARKSL